MVSAIGGPAPSSVTAHGARTIPAGPPSGLAPASLGTGVGSTLRRAGGCSEGTLSCIDCVGVLEEAGAWGQSWGTREGGAPELPGLGVGRLHNSMRWDRGNLALTLGDLGRTVGPPLAEPALFCEALGTSKNLPFLPDITRLWGHSVPHASGFAKITHIILVPFKRLQHPWVEAAAPSSAGPAN